jgi:ATP-dependent DNA ligase
MSKITRIDEYAAPERGPDWMGDLFNTLSNLPASTAGIQDVLDLMTGRQQKSIEAVVKSYREQCGMDALADDADGDELISTAGTLGPIAPMKLRKVESLDEVLKDHQPKDLIVQVKFDGFKTQAIRKAGKVDLYTRRGESFTENVPELVAELNKVMPDNSFILGELVWEDKDGKQSISDIQTVVGSNPAKAHEKIKSGGGKVVFQVYDLLWASNNDLTTKPYEKRYNLLKDLVGNHGSIKVARNYTWEERDKAQKDAIAKNCEGLVIKPRDSKYKYAALGENEPTGEQVKFKKGVKAKETDVILNSYHKGESKLIFPAYQHKGAELFEVGQLSGMSKEEETQIKRQIDAGKSVVVQVSYQEVMESGKLRHIGFMRIRDDKPAKEVKTASKKEQPMRKLSKRHITAEVESVITIITNDPEIKKAIESFSRNSGGTKSTTSIIQFLRERLGPSVKFNDQDLINYIEDIKKSNKLTTRQDTVDVGRVGLDKENAREDDVADYISHSTTK